MKGYARIRCIARFVFLNIMRSKLKSFIITATAIVFMLALGFFCEAIFRMEVEIDRLYETIPITVEVFPSDHRGIAVAEWRIVDDVISMSTIQSALDANVLTGEYLEAAYAWSLVLPESDDGSFPLNWMDVVGYNENSELLANESNMDMLLATSDISLFISEHSRSSFDEIPGNARELPDGSQIGYLAINYKDGFDESSFKHSDGMPIPIIMSENSLARRNMLIGDEGYMVYSDVFIRGMAITWNYLPIVVIGSHNRNIIGFNTQDAVLLPLSALEQMLNPYLGFSKARFKVDPQQAKDIAHVIDVLDGIVSYNNLNVMSGYAILSVEVHDEELYAVIKPLDKSLDLLKQLYPAAIALSVAVAVGLSLVVVFQCTKIAAIMRIQGLTKWYAKVTLCAEQCILVLLGLLIGICLIKWLGWGNEKNNIAITAFGYFVGTFAGSVFGSIVVTMRPPLELLQARE